nr:hypothetical protein [Tanacetum cinerariifolium]
MFGDCSCSCVDGVLDDGSSWSMEVDKGQSGKTITLGASSLAKPVHKCGNVTCLLDECRGNGGGTWDDPEAPGALDAPNGPAGGGGGCG